MKYTFLLFLFPVFLTAQTTTETFDVYFEHGQWKPEKQDYLQFLRKTRNGEATVQLDGYTDSTSSDSFNNELAEKRMNALIAAAGLKDVRKINHGEKDFDPAFGMAGNRRVRITLTIISIGEAPKAAVVKAPEKAEPSYEEPAMGKRLTTRIKFYNASSKMREYSIPEVDEIAMYMRSHPTVLAELHGHVCCTQNTPMSLERAEAVKTALIKRGIDGNRITCLGHGNTERLNDEQTEEERDENRRVEVLFREPG